MTLENLLNEMWIDYCQLNPSAKKIYDFLTEEGEIVLNDHIALRTFNHPKTNIEVLAAPFKKFGYVEKGEYEFTQKKLFAKHYEHPNSDLPKIFISELELEKMSPFVRETCNSLVEQIPEAMLRSDKLVMSGRPWPMTIKTYEKLAEESEYASWVAAFGYRPNHFTVNINALKKFSDIRVLNDFIRSKGYQLNQSGGEVKGSPEELLEQSSTMAKEIPVQFEDGTQSIPGCYYEFAKRYALPDGKLYQGFIAKSADKIFESTNRVRP